MRTETVMHVRLNERDRTFLEEMVKLGYSSNKSDVLRTALHLYQYSALCDRVRQQHLKVKPLPEILKELKQIRKQVHQRYWGNQ